MLYLAAVLLVLLVYLTVGRLRAQEPRGASPGTTGASSASTAKPPVTKNLGVEQFDKLRSNTNAVILDVRTPSEFAQGHLPGAVLLDFKAPDFAERLANLDKSKQYLVHCAAGVRSAKACTKMESLGFTNLINLEGGLTAWKQAGKPVAK
ncbi:MAG TPA: rhodanese-like domain-containing protein [Verrucomicrobiota bacterium]|nr:rhodanese-like domain-containing protein [Verrucomicrobiales bacterium]HRI11438.1 rhodanese-like domain-containing protein [Verrucomicrobiota bacterium]